MLVFAGFCNKDFAIPVEILAYLIFLMKNIYDIYLTVAFLRINAFLTNVNSQQKIGLNH